MDAHALKPRSNSQPALAQQKQRPRPLRSVSFEPPPEERRASSPESTHLRDEIGIQEPPPSPPRRRTPSIEAVVIRENRSHVVLRGDNLSPNTSASASMSTPSMMSIPSQEPPKISIKQKIDIEAFNEIYKGRKFCRCGLSFNNLGGVPTLQSADDLRSVCAPPVGRPDAQRRNPNRLYAKFNSHKEEYNQPPFCRSPCHGIPNRTSRDSSYIRRPVREPLPTPDSVTHGFGGQLEDSAGAQEEHTDIDTQCLSPSLERPYKYDREHDGQCEDFQIFTASIQWDTGAGFSEGRARGLCECVGVAQASQQRIGEAGWGEGRTYITPTQGRRGRERRNWVSSCTESSVARSRASCRNIRTVLAHACITCSRARFHTSSSSGGDVSRGQAGEQAHPASSMDGFLDGAAEDLQKAKKGGYAGVSDRINALEERGAKPPILPHSGTFHHLLYGRKDKPLPTRRKDQGNLPEPVFPLHVRRFVRRSSLATPATPAAPRTPWTFSDQRTPPPLQQPQPARTIRSIQSIEPEVLTVDTPPPNAQSYAALDTSRGDNDPLVIHAGYGRRATPAFAVRRTAHPHELSNRRGTATAKLQTAMEQGTGLGTMEDCMRHGRRQPYGSSVVVDTICPDCLAEQDIKQRERLRNADGTVLRPTTEAQVLEPERSASPSTYTDSLFETLPPLERVDSQWIQADQQLAMESRPLVVARDLGETLDTLILQHDGKVDSVVMNVRNGEATATKLRKLALDLQMIAQRIFDDNCSGDVNSRHVYPSRRLGGERAATAAPLGASRSMPELLGLIDEVAGGFVDPRSNTGQLTPKYGEPPASLASVDSGSMASRQDDWVLEGNVHFSMHSPAHSRSTSAMAEFKGSEASEEVAYTRLPRHTPVPSSRRLRGVSFGQDPDLLIPDYHTPSVSSSRSASPGWSGSNHVTPGDVSPFVRNRYRAPKSAIAPYWKPQDEPNSSTEVLRRSSATQTTPAIVATEHTTYEPGSNTYGMAPGPSHDNATPSYTTTRVAPLTSQRPYQMSIHDYLPTPNAVREQQQIIRNAMRMETESRSKQAAAAERETRRRRLVDAREARARAGAKEAVMGAADLLSPAGVRPGIGRGGESL